MISFHIEMDGLDEIESALGMMKDKSKRVLTTAINTTARQTVNLLVNEANNDYYISKGKIRKRMSTKKATTSRREAVVKAEGKVNHLYDFKVSPKTYIRGGGAEKGYKVKVKRGSLLKPLVLRPGAMGDKYKAFIVEFKSGHVTLGQRVPGKKMKSKPKKEYVKDIFAPSVPTMLGYEEGVYGKVEPMIYAKLQDNIQEQIKKTLEKGA